MHSQSRKSSDGIQLAKGLGWFSVGLGTAELAAPRMLARLIGVEAAPRTSLLLRALGARELMSGFGILGKPGRAGPLWSRVVGDAVDLGLLAWAMKRRATNAQRIGAAIVAVGGVTLLDVIASALRQRAQRHGGEPIIRTTTINRSPAEVYAHWRNLEDLPAFMTYLESVRELDDTRSRWIAKLPTGNTIEWLAEITEDIPGQRISWRATSGPELSGTVIFTAAAGGRGTEVRVVMKVGNVFEKMIAGPQVSGDLRRFKQVLETGEVMKSDASIHKLPHAARPSGPEEV